ncbi:MAG: hypothetical protein AB7O96_16565 [Pseudobdellovibrionaceae bacterium]
MSTKFNCFSCGKELSFAGIVGRRDECPHCRNDVHVCKNCAHYDPKAYNECKEPQADVVQEKDRANFCDYFSPGLGKGPQVSQKEALMAAAEALFKKK